MLKVGRYQPQKIQSSHLKRIKNDIECPIYMLESTRIITISL